MPKDKELTQEEINAQNEKFRTFFTTSVVDVPADMIRRDDEVEEKPKGLFGRLFRREKNEEEAPAAPQKESGTGEIQLGEEVTEEPADLELALTPEPIEPEVERPAVQPETLPVEKPHPAAPSRPEKPAEPQPRMPEPRPMPKQESPAEKQEAPRKKAVQFEPRTPQEQYEDREMQALKAMLFGVKQPPEETPQPAKPQKPAVQAAPPQKSEEPEKKTQAPAAPKPEIVFAEEKTTASRPAPARQTAMQFFGRAEDEERPSAPIRTTPPDRDDSMSIPLIMNEEETAHVQPETQPVQTPVAPAAPAETPAASQTVPEAPAEVPEEPDTETPEDVGEQLHKMGAALTLRCVLGGILALVLLNFGLAAEGLVGPLAGLDPVTAPAAFYAANLLFLVLAMAVGWPILRDGLQGLRDREHPSTETMPALAACAALVQAAVALLNAQNYQASSFTLLSGIAALGLFLATLGDRVMLASVENGYRLAKEEPEHRGAFRIKDKDLIRVLAQNMEQKDPWVLLSRPTELDSALVEQSFGPRACERRSRKTTYILLGMALLAGFVFLVMGGGVNGGAAALTAVLCMGAPLSSTLIAGLTSLRLQQSAGAAGAVVPGWAAIEELGGVDTVQVDADELFAPDSAMLQDIRIFKGGRIDRAILYSASVLSQCCNTLSGLFRQIIEDRTDILYPIKDLEVHRGLGFAAWCDNNHILIGTRAYMEQEEIPLPDEEYEAKHSKNGQLQILYLAVSGSLHAMFVLRYVGGKNTARALEQLQKENIQLLVSCQDPSLTARHITDAYRLPEGMVVLLEQEQCDALKPATAPADSAEGCCVLCTKGFVSLTAGLRAAEQAQNAETTATTVQLVSVWFSVAIAFLLTYAGSVGMLSVAAVLMYQAAWSALSIAVAALKQHS